MDSGQQLIMSNVQYHKQFTTKSDVWSFGVLIFEIVTYSRQPYAGTQVVKYSYDYNMIVQSTYQVGELDIFTGILARVAGMTNKEIIEKINGRYRLENPDGSSLGSGVTDGDGATVVCPPVLYQIMTQCWDGNPERRPTFDYLHKTFDNYQISVDEGGGYVDNALAVPSSPDAPQPPPSFEAAIHSSRK